MLANSLIVLMFFLYHEGFYLLPESMTIIPGVFRMSDAFFVIIPFFSFGVLRTFSRYREESLMVFSFCALMLLSCLMGQIFFPQTFLEGLLNVRRTFFWLSFFAFIPLIRNLERAESLLKLLTFLVGIYVVMLLITKYFPDLGLIHPLKKYYNTKGGLVRFGESRFFFPYGTIPVMFYFLALARIIHGSVKESNSARFFRMSFVLIVIYAVLSSYTRGLVFPTLIASAFALFRCKKPLLKYAAVSFAILIISFQVLNMAMDDGGGSILNETKLGKMLFKTGELAPETGRMTQASMYITQVLKSPITGVGTFAVTRFAKYKDGGVVETYKTYGYFAASDLGYLKILGDNGLLGIAWVVWWFVYFYRRSSKTLKIAINFGNVPFIVVLVSGLQYYVVFILISGVSLGHFNHPGGITVQPLVLALMAIASRTVNELAEQTVKEPSPLIPEMNRA